MSVNLVRPGGVHKNMNDDKRLQRKLKRDIKRAGTRKLRQHLKRDLTRDPAAADDRPFDYGRHASAPLNGADNDATRRRAEDVAPDGPS